MAYETTDMMKARHALQDLSASDPAASANMCRYLKAMTLMITGLCARELVRPEPMFGAVFQLTQSERNLIMKSVMVTGIQHVILAFNVDDPCAAPVGLGVFRPERGEQVCYSKCRLWAPLNGGRAVIVPTETGQVQDGHFVFRRGRPLVRVASLVSGDLDAGFRRGTARLERIASSPELRNAADGVHRHIVKSAGPGKLGISTMPVKTQVGRGLA